MNIKAYYLLQENQIPDEYGDIQTDIKKRKVYPSVSSTRQSEFYAAQAQGLKLEKKVTIREFEYKGESKIQEDDTVYEIVRTFSIGDGNMELVLKRGVNINVSA
ncbi:MAG: head-tail adaptor protein [Candidatus Galacturonibacter soehngenii]|nr:head-tail adaptor protein [Candidatus Galacturonibacter soehngenii]